MSDAHVGLTSRHRQAHRPAQFTKSRQHDNIQGSNANIIHDTDTTFGSSIAQQCGMDPNELLYSHNIRIKCKLN